MYGFDETITVYNPTIEPTTGYDTYSRTVINGCSWCSKHSTAASSTALVRESTHQIRIPSHATAQKVYAAPHEFSNPDTQFTLTERAILVRGEATLAITRSDELQGKFADICRVKAVHDNRSLLPGHIFVEGV